MKALSGVTREAVPDTLTCHLSLLDSYCGSEMVLPVERLEAPGAEETHIGPRRRREGPCLRVVERTVRARRRPDGHITKWGSVYTHSISVLTHTH